MEEKEYNIYRGLQKPLIMFRLKGSSIGIAAFSLIGVLLSLFVGLSMFSLFVTLLIAAIPALIGAAKLNRNFKEGLHRKKKYPGVWIVKNLVKETK